MDQDENLLSLAQQLNSIVKATEELNGERAGPLSDLDRRDDRVQAQVTSTLQLINRCKDNVQQASLYSRNEEREDLETSILPFLRLDYLRGQVLQQRAKKIGAETSLTDNWQTAREAFDAWADFIDLVQGYGIAQPTSEYSRSSADDTRSDKIRLYQERLELKTKRDELKLRVERHQNVDEEILRELYLLTLKYDHAEACQGLQSLQKELDLLAMAKEQPVTNMASPTKSLQGDNDWRLDASVTTTTARRNGPLLSQQGKPLQPFTILPTGKTRQEIRNGVFQPGHRLPTMSIDEYLENEAKRGNIINADSTRIAQPDDDDDDETYSEDKSDLQTYKDRDWDEFKDNNPRGSGNTLSNRG